MATVGEMAAQYGVSVKDVISKLGLKNANSDTQLSQAQLDALQKGLGALDPSDPKNSMDSVQIANREKTLEEQNFQALYGNPEYVAKMNKAKQKSQIHQFGEFMKWMFWDFPKSVLDDLMK